MTFSIYIPDAPDRASPPPAVMYWLSGLTCSDENARTKAAMYEHAAKYNLAIVFPDTSARGDHIKIPGQDDSYDFGSGAGFYVNAKTPDWKEHYNMYDYITKELPSVVN